MRYDPQRHHRRSIRLPGWDYTSPGAYFVTLVTHDRECLFGRVVDGEMVLSPWGKNERELNAVRRYIRHNPLGWAHDMENPNREAQPGERATREC